MSLGFPFIRFPNAFRFPFLLFPFFRFPLFRFLHSVSLLSGSHKCRLLVYITVFVLNNRCYLGYFITGLYCQEKCRVTRLHACIKKVDYSVQNTLRNEPHSPITIKRQLTMNKTCLAVSLHCGGSTSRKYGAAVNMISCRMIAKL